MRDARSSTIGTERITNYALQIKSREEFIRQLTANLPARPEYFLQDAEINREGAPALTELPPLRQLLPAELKSRMERGIPALDVRPGDQFAAAHVPGSVNIPLSGQFATWAGTVLGLSSRPVLIAATEQEIDEARMRLARVGIEDVSGYLAGGIEAWKQAGFERGRIPQLSANELQARLESKGLRVLDVRREGEWQAGHIAGADWWPLDKFRAVLPQVDSHVPLAVHCKSGYRSMIACSLLKRAGYDNVINVIGGFDAWQNAKLPVETTLPVKI